ncbi:MAG: TlpA family protein disulfide reductase, partial [Pseudomonadota bacterium]|nr:TlpA family protein disulfide reductase [Pseudomonadota bacterium]
NAVMAGCKPEYLPVVIAAIEAVCTDDFNIHGVMATTMGASPVMVVNGPIRHRIGMSMGIGALGQGNRANATIGRALRLTVRNVGGAVPGGTERSTLSNPMKFTMCFAEWEERSSWEPLHVERGFDAEDSVVTLFAMTSGPVLTVDEGSLDGSALAGTLGQATHTILNARAYSFTNCLLVVSPEHVDTFKRGDYSKAEVRRRMQEVTAKTYRDLMVDDASGVGLKPEQAALMGEDKLDAVVEKFKEDQDIYMVVAGSEAGKFTGAFHGWLTGSRGSIPVSQKIGT